jgi:hypothetical protein
MMVRNIILGLGRVLLLTGGVLMGSSSATTPATPLGGSTGGYGPLAWFVLTKPILGISFVVLGLSIMFRAGRRNIVPEERLPRRMD